MSQHETKDYTLAGVGEIVEFGKDGLKLDTTDEVRFTKEDGSLSKVKAAEGVDSDDVVVVSQINGLSTSGSIRSIVLDTTYPDGNTEIGVIPANSLVEEIIIQIKDTVADSSGLSVYDVTNSVEILNGSSVDTENAVAYQYKPLYKVDNDSTLWLMGRFGANTDELMIIVKYITL